MSNKLVVIKAKYYLTAEERKKMSEDIKEMMEAGVLIINNEMEHISVVDIDQGKMLSVNADEKKCEIKKLSPPGRKKFFGRMGSGKGPQFSQKKNFLNFFR